MASSTINPEGIHPPDSTISVFFTIASVPDGSHCFSNDIFIGKGYKLIPNASSATHMANNGVTLHSNSDTGLAHIYVSSSSTLKGGSYNVIGNIAPDT